MRTLSDGLIHSDVAELNVNNLSGMKLLEGNYDCYLESQRPIRYLTSSLAEQPIQQCVY